MRRHLQRLALATSGGVLGSVWRLAYRTAARRAAAALSRGERGASVYARAGAGSGDVVPGVSDIDLVVVADDPGAAVRVRSRHRALLKRAPFLRGLIDLPATYTEADLDELATSSYTTFGLETGEAAYADSSRVARVRLLQRPPLHGDYLDWTLVRGRERRPPGRGQTAQQRRQAAWLELSFWWWHALALAGDPDRADAAHLCVKLGADPARAWLWLTHGERVTSRTTALARLAEELPETSQAIAQLLHAQRATSARPPIAGALTTLARVTELTAETITRESLAQGSRPVRLTGVTSACAIPLDGTPPTEPPGDSVPLCDWRALAVPTHADESMRWRAGDPAEPATLNTAHADARPGAAVAVASGSFAVFPVTVPERALPRRLACRATEPVVYAVAEGRGEASFPEAAGWSIADTAARAVAEQRARLTPPTGARDLAELARLLVAARPALVAETAAEGDPVIPVTLAATAQLLGERGAGGVAAEAAAALAGEPADPAALARELRAAVSRLRAYA